MKLSALLRDILFLTTSQSTNNSNTDSSPTSNSNPYPTPTPSLLPRQGFTDPNLISQPTTFYETASALIISNGRTYTTTYIDLISATAAFPVTPSTTTTTTPIAIPKPATSPTITNPLISSSGTLLSGPLSLAATPSPSTSSVPVTTSPLNPTTTPAPVPPPSTESSSSVTPTITSITSPSSTSPVLDLAPCSTYTDNESALEGCISSVVGGLSLTGGGPIIATTSSSVTSTITTIAAPTTVTPTRTVTMPYLGAVVAKGKATFVVGGVEKESRGVRGRGGGRGVLVGLGVGLVVMLGV